MNLLALSEITGSLMNRRSRFALPTLILVVAFLQTAMLFVVIPKISGHLGPIYNGDQYADGYDELASNLAAGNGYRVYPETAPTLMREPGYPVLLAGIFILFGKNFTVVKLANMFLAFAAGLLITRIAGRVSSSQV